MKTDPELDARLLAYLLGELDAEGIARLERELRERPEAAERLAVLAVQDMALHRVMGASGERPAASTAPPPRAGGRRWLAVAAVFAAINIAGFAWVISLLKAPAPGLAVEAFRPEGETGPAGPVVIRFNQPMVPPEETGKPPAADAPVPSFSPPIGGRFTWEDAKTLRFDPDRRLPLGTAFTAVVPRRLGSAWGAALGADAVFQFRTAALDVVSVAQRRITPDRRVTLALRFNQAVAREELLRGLSAATPDGTAVKLEVPPQAPHETLLAETAPVEGRAVVVRLARGLRGVEGPLGLAADVARTVELDDVLTIREVRAEMGDGQPLLSVACSHEILVRDAKGFIRIDPPVDFTVSLDWQEGFHLNGPFRPDTRYRLTFLAGLKGAHGAVLRQEVARTVPVPDLPPALRFRTVGLFMAARGSLLLPLEGVNVASATVETERIYENNLVYYLRERHRGTGPSGLGRALPARTVAFGGKRNEPETVPLDLRELAGPEPRGVFRVTARDATSGWRADRHLLLVTDLGVTVKRSPTDLLVWVNSLSEARPVGGAAVSVYTRSNQKILAAVTDGSGLARLPAPAGDGEEAAPIAVTVATEGDLSFLELGAAAVSLASFDAGGQLRLRTGYDAFLYADRGIYRPGETVRLRAIVRAPGPEPAGAFPVELRVKRPDGRPFRTDTLALSAQGDAGLDLAIPDAAHTGRYEAELRVPRGDRPLGAMTFLVEEFLPDRMKVEVEAPERRFAADERIPFAVRASHLVGLPAAGRAAEARVQWVPVDFAHPDWKGYRFADSARGTPSLNLPGVPVTLDAKGGAAFPVKAPKGLDAPSAVAAVLTVSVREEGGRAVSASARRDVDLRPVYVGLSPAREGHASPGAPAEFLVACVRPDGTRVPAAVLEAVVHRVRWNTVLKRVPGPHGGHTYRYESQRETEKVLEGSCGIAGGRGVAAFTPDRPGEYELRVRDPETGASADLVFYCAGAGYVPWPREKPDVVELVPDRKTYAAGETARILVKSPFAGTALLTVEGDRIHLARTLALEANTREVEVPVDAAWAPNVHCTVSVLRPHDPAAPWGARRAFGTVPLAVDCAPRRLQVALDAPAEARPGTTLRVALQARDAAGAGVRAAVTLAAVDEGICRLTRYAAPDPWGHFYAKRALEVATADAYALLMPEFQRPAVGADRAPGGDGEEESDAGADLDARLLNPVQARRVRPVALWAGRLETGPDGRAEAAFDLPAHFTGELRLVAVAAASKAFGSAERAVLVRQPLMIATSFPRFLAPGDVFEIPVTVYNRTGADGAAEVRLDGGGLAVEPPFVRRVDVRKDGEATVRFRATAPARPGAVAATAAAALGAERAEEAVELAVRPPTVLRHLAGGGRVPAGQTARVALPGGWMPGTESARLSCAPLPTLALGGGLEHLLGYPYGCVEQTTSRCFPLVYLGDLAALVAPGTFGREEVGHYVLAGIDRLLLMQTGSGGFAYWPGGSDADPWASAYAAHFLVEAKKAGYAVHADLLDGALRYLQTRVLGEAGDAAPAEAKAYAVYVLALGGKPDLSWTYRLQEGKDDLPAYARAHVAVALALTRERDLAQSLLRAPIPAPAPGRDTGGLLHSAAREAAILLSAYLDVDPAHEAVPRLVERLEGFRKDGRWATTQENAFALLALGKYARRAAAEPSDFRAVVRRGGEVLRSFTHRDRVVLDLAGLAGGEVEIAVEGTGALYYAWSVAGIPGKDDAPESDQGIRARRRFLTREGRPLDPAAIPQGELVVVEIAIDGGRAAKHLVVADLLPAGLEIQNPRIVTQAPVSTPALPRNDETNPVSGPEKDEKEAAGPRPLAPRHVEMRDDRLLLFADVDGHPAGHVHRYVARAVTRGRFRLPALQAECMYDPSVASRNGAGWIEVVGPR
jgi:hypothetical protein